MVWQCLNRIREQSPALVRNVQTVRLRMQNAEDSE